MWARVRVSSFPWAELAPHRSQSLDLFSLPGSLLQAFEPGSREVHILPQHRQCHLHTAMWLPLHGAMLTPAPGLCWVFILLITTNEMGRASPRRRKGRTGVRSWGCLELPCFCLLYYLGKSPVSCLILKRV